MKCKYCAETISTLLKDEMQCFSCYDAAVKAAGMRPRLSFCFRCNKKHWQGEHKK